MEAAVGRGSQQQKYVHVEDDSYSSAVWAGSFVEKQENKGDPGGIRWGSVGILY